MGFLIGVLADDGHWRGTYCVTLIWSLAESTHTLSPCPVTVGEFVIDAGAVPATLTVMVTGG
jgi:hypothetical protein